MEINEERWKADYQRVVDYYAKTYDDVEHYFIPLEHTRHIMEIYIRSREADPRAATDLWHLIHSVLELDPLVDWALISVGGRFIVITPHPVDPELPNIRAKAADNPLASLLSGAIGIPIGEAENTDDAQKPKPRRRKMYVANTEKGEICIAPEYFEQESVRNITCSACGVKPGDFELKFTDGECIVSGTIQKEADKLEKEQE